MFGSDVKFDSDVRHSVLVESGAQLANPVMVRDATTRGQNLLTCTSLYRLVRVNRIWPRTCVVEREVEVDAAAAVVRLRHTAADHEMINIEALALASHTLLYVVA